MAAPGGDGALLLNCSPSLEEGRGSSAYLSSWLVFPPPPAVTHPPSPFYPPGCLRERSPSLLLLFTFPPPPSSPPAAELVPPPLRAAPACFWGRAGEGFFFFARAPFFRISWTLLVSGGISVAVLFLPALERGKGRSC